MGLTVAVKNEMLNTAKAYFKKLYLINDASLSVALGSTVGTHSEKVMGAARDLLFSTAASSKIETENDTQTSPLVYTLAEGTVFHRLAFTDDNATEGSRIFYGFIDLEGETECQYLSVTTYGSPTDESDTPPVSCTVGFQYTICVPSGEFFICTVYEGANVLDTPSFPEDGAYYIKKIEIALSEVE